MLRYQARRSGFTLIELAIVLSVIGVLTIGLFRLMSTSNQQTKDQVVAQQQLGLMNAVKGYLADTSTGGGQGWLTGLGVGVRSNLPIPSSCPGTAGTQAGVFCGYLPSGFTSGTTNAYAQNYVVQVVAGASSATQNYSFMIIATGKVVPDADGARIAGLIGGDGGFIYTANVCGTPAKRACGSMGSWQIADVTASYGFTAAQAAAGSVASRSFVTAQADNSNFWLARVAMPGDTTALYNTMQTGLYLGSGTNNLYLYSTAAASGNSNQILLGNGSIQGNGNSIPAAAQLELGGSGVNNYLIQLTTGCSILDAAPPVPCYPALSTTKGDVGVAGAVTATKVYSSSDIRLKTDIHPLVDPLAEVMKLDAVSFAFKSNGNKGMGVIAQELEKIYPQLVSESNGTKYVDYNGLIGPLIGAVQQLKHDNDDLRAQLKAQSAREETLEQKLRAKTQP